MVVYANQFRSYGNLVIIENDQGYYCILSGMKKIMISSGNEVFIGEPIAKISAGNKSQLYFELRLNGKIILVPTRAIEFIAINFIITNSGVSFE